MYKDFFGLRESPFNVNPDPRYLLLTPQMRDAFDEITYGISARKGLILLTGEVGTGKTTLINRLLDWLREQGTPTAFVFNSHLQSNHLLDFILTDFGVPHDPGLNDNARLRLNQWLVDRYRKGGAVPVLIVDEAQGLMTEVLEEVRMLLNLETPHDKLLQIVLAGQPELEERLRQPELRQIKQRIALRCKTAALSLAQTHDYIETRLRIAGAGEQRVFAPEAVDAVHFYSGGIPRVVNLLCEHALIGAYVDDLRPVPAYMIRDVAREFQFDDIKHPAALPSAPLPAPNAAPAEREPVHAFDYRESVPGAAANRGQESPQSGAAAPFDIAGVLFGLSIEPAALAADYSAHRIVDGGGESGAVTQDCTSLQPSESAIENALRVEQQAAFPSSNATPHEEQKEEMLPLAMSAGIHLVETRQKDEPEQVSSHPAPVESSNVHAAPATKLRQRGWRKVHASTVSRAWMRASVAWNGRLFSRASLPAWAQMSAAEALRPFTRSVEKYAGFLETEQWLRIKESVTRWLREPWNPNARRFADARFLALRHKKS